MNVDRLRIVKFLGHRYETFNPFIIADKLNVPIEWVDLGDNLLGKVSYFGDDPIIMLNESLHEINRRYFICAHELAHVINHVGLDGYYVLNKHGYDKLEFEATDFAVDLLINMYEEDFDCLPNTFADLQHAYGIPEQ